MEILGYIKAMIFNEPSIPFFVAKVILDDKNSEIITVVGKFKLENTNKLIRFTGEYVDHPVYGMQFDSVNANIVLPTDREQIIRFLSSPLFDRIGKKSAEKIVDYLGNDCIEKIKKEPSIIEKIDITERQKESLKNGLCQKDYYAKTAYLFKSLGLDAKILQKVESVYSDKMAEVIEDNPYVLIDTIDGISFDIADSIAMKLNFDRKDSKRLSALLVYCIKNICYVKKDTYITDDLLYKATKEIMPELTYEEFTSTLEELISTKELVRYNDGLAYKTFFISEYFIANFLCDFASKRSSTIPNDLLGREINRIEMQENIKYSNDQIAAIESCFKNNISIISGGPGTGKTTIVKAIINIYKNYYSDKKVVICAPTGRAAKRISELTDNSACTIHRLLGWDLETNTYAIDSRNPIIGDFLIIDEFSMVDCLLFYHLLDAASLFSKILIIGDNEQLPPVLPGDPFRDIINSQLIQISYLNNIHRQSDNSGIIPLCYDIRKSNIDLTNLQKNDVKFIESSSIDIPQIIISLIQKALDEGYSKKDIQVLSPMYTGIAGITNLNNKIREYFNPKSINKNEIMIGTTLYREGDKILQIKNQPNDDVYNGDIGILEEISVDESNKSKYTLVVNFDGNYVVYDAMNSMNIRLAYCISVHKAQGSEYPVVIIPLVDEHRFMLRKRLIYTGVSRAKEALYLIGSLTNFRKGITLMDASRRKSNLSNLIEYFRNNIDIDNYS